MDEDDKDEADKTDFTIVSTQSLNRFEQNLFKHAYGIFLLDTFFVTRISLMFSLKIVIFSIIKVAMFMILFLFRPARCRRLLFLCKTFFCWPARCPKHHFPSFVLFAKVICFH